MMEIKDTEEKEETEEEIQEHWLQLQQRLKEKGIWREDE